MGHSADLDCGEMPPSKVPEMLDEENVPDVVIKTIAIKNVAGLKADLSAYFGVSNSKGDEVREDCCG